MIKLKIDGMTCKHCAMGVKQAISGVPGVKGPVEVNLEKGEAAFESAQSLEDVIQAVEEEGYQASKLD